MPFYHPSPSDIVHHAESSAPAASNVCIRLYHIVIILCTIKFLLHLSCVQSLWHKCQSVSSSSVGIALRIMVMKRSKEIYVMETDREIADRFNIEVLRCDSGAVVCTTRFHSD
jgi:hypothetical protein